MYGKTKLNAHYFTTKGFYIFFIPVKVPYKAIYQLAQSAGVKKAQEHGPILEKGSLFGFGWIGVEIEKPSTQQKDVVHISGDFETYRHTGPYKTLGQAYKKIKKDRTNLRECFNIYLDDPAATAPEKCRTDILFR